MDTKQVQTNVFTHGLNMDTHALTTSNTVLTDCINGTLITKAGNEPILQNDMGNIKVENCSLNPGYIPVAMKSWGSVLYIVSYNPYTKAAEFGSYPSINSSEITRYINTIKQNIQDINGYIDFSEFVDKYISKDPIDIINNIDGEFIRLKLDTEYPLLYYNIYNDVGFNTLLYNRKTIELKNDLYKGELLVASPLDLKVNISNGDIYSTFINEDWEDRKDLVTFNIEAEIKISQDQIDVFKDNLYIRIKSDHYKELNTVLELNVVKSESDVVLKAETSVKLFLDSYIIPDFSKDWTQTQLPITIDDFKVTPFFYINYNDGGVNKDIRILYSELSKSFSISRKLLNVGYDVFKYKWYNYKYDGVDEWGNPINIDEDWLSLIINVPDNNNIIKQYFSLNTLGLNTNKELISTKSYQAVNVDTTSGSKTIELGFCVDKIDLNQMFFSVTGGFGYKVYLNINDKIITRYRKTDASLLIINHPYFWNNFIEVDNYNNIYLNDWASIPIKAINNITYNTKFSDPKIHTTINTDNNLGNLKNIGKYNQVILSNDQLSYNDIISKELIPLVKEYITCNTNLNFDVEVLNTFNHFFQNINYNINAILSFDDGEQRLELYKIKNSTDVVSDFLKNNSLTSSLELNNIYTIDSNLITSSTNITYNRDYIYYNSSGEPIKINDITILKESENRTLFSPILKEPGVYYLGINSIYNDVNCIGVIKVNENFEYSESDINNICNFLNTHIYINSVTYNNYKYIVTEGETWEATMSNIRNNSINVNSARINIAATGIDIFGISSEDILKDPDHSILKNFKHNLNIITYNTDKTDSYISTDLNLKLEKSFNNDITTYLDTYKEYLNNYYFSTYKDESNGLFYDTLDPLIDVSKSTIDFTSKNNINNVDLTILKYVEYGKDYIYLKIDDNMIDSELNDNSSIYILNLNINIPMDKNYYLSGKFFYKE